MLSSTKHIFLKLRTIKLVRSQFDKIIYLHISGCLLAYIFLSPTGYLSFIVSREIAGGLYHRLNGCIRYLNISKKKLVMWFSFIHHLWGCKISCCCESFFLKVPPLSEMTFGYFILREGHCDMAGTKSEWIKIFYVSFVSNDII